MIASISAAQPRRWVVMGVSACGKSTVGRLLALGLDVAFVEGDDYHPAANIAKMSAGSALTDADRAAWLAALQARLAQACAEGAGLVMSCSALKRRYRDQLRMADPALCFAHLDGPATLLARRLGERHDHYMPPSLLGSQLHDLEPLGPDEAGLRLDIGASAAQLAAHILTWRKA